MFDVLLNDSNSILMQNFESKVTALTLANVSTSQKPEFESGIIKFKKVTRQNSRLPRIGLPSIQIPNIISSLAQTRWQKEHYFK